MNNQETLDIIIACIKKCTTLDQLTVLRKLHSDNPRVIHEIIMRSRDLHAEATLKAISKATKENR